MLTKQQIIEAFEAGRQGQTIDGRDITRLAKYFEAGELDKIGVKLREGVTDWAAVAFTRDAVLEDLRGDLEFAFEKALHQRGLSAASMYEVVKMWMWVLEDPLQHFNGYAQYGLPFLKAVAIKYEFPNPIGDDAGDERKYASGG